MKMLLSLTIPLLMLAKTIFAECSTHSFTSCADNIVHWYDPNTGEVCDPLDCGGGRAPPKTDVPGCPLYTGTATRTTSYLSCWTPSVSASSTTAPVSSAQSTVDTTATTMASSTTDTTATDIASSTTDTASTESTPSITAAATPSTQTIVGSSTASSIAAGNGTLSTSALPKSTPNVGHLLDGSLLAVAGAAIGAIALI